MPGSPFRSLPHVAAGRFYRPELDCLRFFAFLGVFIHHTCSSEAQYYAARHIPFAGLIASVARAGSFGVDLFFLLSAFLITELLLREKEQRGAVSLRSFYVRRILRIWPLYFLGISIAALMAFLDPAQVFPLRYVIAFLLLSGNWLISIAGFPISVMNSLWTVSFEEQFYLLWPAIVRKVRVGSLWLACPVLLITAELSRLIVMKYSPLNTTLFTNTLTRLDPIALGIATTLAIRRFPIRLGTAGRAISLILGIAVWLVAGHFFGVSYAFALIGYPAMALGSWLIFVAVYGVNFAPRVLAYLGKISYGLYVFHNLAFYFLWKLFGHYPHTMREFVVFCGLGLAFTIAMAAFSYRFFESPFLRLKERFALVKSREV